MPVEFQKSTSGEQHGSRSIAKLPAVGFSFGLHLLPVLTLFFVAREKRKKREVSAAPRGRVHAADCCGLRRLT